MSAPDPGALFEREGITYQVERVHHPTRTVTLVQRSGLGRPRELKWEDLPARGYRPVRSRDEFWPG